MTREQIEQAAEQHSERWLNDSEEYFRNHNRDIYEYGFIAGAGWRIDSVWHDAKEAPKYSEMLIVINKDGKPFICGPNNSDWKISVKIFNIVKWAYISDLIPDGKEETK